jgi:NAD(P)-dependent dehydrogenase (short-subunit alcohol dehydrogenase family)
MDDHRFARTPGDDSPIDFFLIHSFITIAIIFYFTSEEVTMLLSNKVAIISGSAKGMGKGMALKFAQEGCAVTIVDIDKTEAQKALSEVLGKGGKGLAIACDVTKEDQVKKSVEKTVKEFGTVDILINNAGAAGVSYPIEEMPEEIWDKTFNLNMKSQFFFCKYVVPIMKAKRSGKIINLSSIGAFQPPAHHIAYNSAKAAIVGFTYDLANALAPYNINVNAMLPGPVRTSFYEQRTGSMNEGEKDEFFAGLGRKVPLQRPGLPEDMAGAALFLASELGAYVTGHALYVTGGLPLLPPVQPM